MCGKSTGTKLLKSGGSGSTPSKTLAYYHLDYLKICARFKDYRLLAANMRFDLVCFGEILYDYYGDKKVLAGAPLNVASVAAALGLRTAMISAISRGEGDAIEGELEKRNVKPYIQRNSRPTGRAVVTLSKGLPSFRIEENSAYDLIEQTAAIRQVVRNASFIYFGTLAQRNVKSKRTLMGLLQGTGAAVIYDVNLREGIPQLESIVRQSVGLADILRVNREELEKLKEIYNEENIVQFLFANEKLSYTFVTGGEKGACVYQPGRLMFCTQAPQVKAVDTTGAGDAFTAAIAYGLSRRLASGEVLKLAVKVASRLVRHKGAFSKEIADDLQVFR